MAVVISDNMVIVGTSDNLPPFPLSHARIGYKSLLTTSNVTASSQAAGFPATAVVNPLTYDQWRPESVPATLTCTLSSAADADYLGIAGHNLSGAVVGVEYSFDGSTWVELQQLSPADNSPIMLIFSTITALAWRLNILSATSTPQIGTIYIGEALAMQRQIYGGHSPITLSRQTETTPNRSEGGQWLGRSIVRKGVATTYEWKHLAALWYRQNFDPFVKVARTRPFFIAWYPSKYPQEIGFVWTTQDIQPQNMGINNLMSVSLNVVGLTDD